LGVVKKLALLHGVVLCGGYELSVGKSSAGTSEQVYGLVEKG
jgi:hypothetical protein